MAGKILEFLDKIGKGLDSKQVKVGFIDGATYPDGTNVAMVAHVQEYGAIIYQPARTQTLEFKSIRGGEISNKFAKKGKGAFSKDVNIQAHAFWVPPRSFLRTTISEKSSDWAKSVERGILAGNGVDNVLEVLGAQIKGDIQEKISTITSPIIKNSTWRARRARGNSSDKPLVDTKVMINDVNYEVGEIESTPDS